MRTNPAADTIDLAIPPRAKYVSVARFAAAAIAARQGFSYDDIEDLKVAVSEACNALIAAAKSQQQPIALRFTAADAALAVQVEAHGNRLDAKAPAVGTRRSLDDRALGVFLMQCLVDEVDVRRAGDQNAITLRMAKGHRERPDAGTAPPDEV